MTITPLQALLRAFDCDLTELRCITKRSRITIWRWKVGLSYPHPIEDVPALMAHFKHAGLDYNGCYLPSVEVTDD